MTERYIDGEVVNIVMVKNLLDSFCCVLDKNILLHFSLLGVLGKQL